MLISTTYSKVIEIGEISPLFLNNYQLFFPPSTYIRCVDRRHRTPTKFLRYCTARTSTFPIVASIRGLSNYHQHVHTYVCTCMYVRIQNPERYYESREGVASVPDAFTGMKRGRRCRWPTNVRANQGLINLSFEYKEIAGQIRNVSYDIRFDGCPVFLAPLAFLSFSLFPIN